MSLAAIFLNGAYVAFVGSAYTRTLAWLRVLLIIGSGSLIVYGTFEKIWPMVIWNVIIITSHLVRIVTEQRAQRSVKLNAAEAEMRDALFPGLADYDFHLLWSMGKTVGFHDSVIIADGSQPGLVSVLIDGVVTIDKAGETRRGLRKGALIGEMSFVSGSPAAVDVVAKGVVTVHQWDQRQLLSLDQAHPPSAKAFRDLITRDLASKAHASLN